MISRCRVLLVSRESATAEAVSASIGSSERLSSAGVCRYLDDVPACLERNEVPIVLVDIDADRPGMLERLGVLTQQFAQARFIVLCSTMENELILRAMQAGARQFVSKTSMNGELSRVLEQLIPTETAGRAGTGSIVTVLSAGGGCGATTLAINLTNELRLVSSRRTLLVDLDCAYGAVAHYLGISGDYGIADVLDRKSQTDTRVIRSCATTYYDDFHVLLSPASIDIGSANTLDYGHVGEALKACMQAYAYTVIDAPRVSMEVAARLAQMSQLTLLVFQLTVKDVKVVRATLEALRRLGVGMDKVAPLANRFGKKHRSLSLKDGQEALGLPELQCVRNDYRNAVRSVTQGEPLARVASSSPLRRDLQTLAASVARNGSSQGAS